MLSPADDLPDSYLDLLKRALMGITIGPQREYTPITVGRDRVRAAVLHQLELRNRVVAIPRDVDPENNPEGTLFVSDLPNGVMTMIGRARLDNVHKCMVTALKDGVPGDVIETGVWQGGTTILMRAVFKAYGINDRKVYVADSFGGLPSPDLTNYPQDQVFDYVIPELAVTMAKVRNNFRLYGLLDDQVSFVRGWFKDSLPALKSNTWSVIRLDGDLYQSTMDALTNLYPQLAPGGFCIIDDFEIPVCAQAVSDYRETHNITDEILQVDWTGIYWRKSG
jgi:hypothetical protein